MKKNYLLMIALFSAVISFGQVTELYFSKYGEGSSNNKFVEIYNGTDATISLDDYAFPTVSNTPDVPGEYEYWNTFPDGASIAPGDVFVIAHPSADQQILDQADMTFQYMSNGDDGMALVKGGVFNDADGDGNVDAGEMTDFTILDWLGDWNGDPGSGWDVAGVTNATQNHTLIRKSSVCGPNDNWDDARGTNAEDSEWIVNDIDTGWDLLGSYSGCVASPTLTITSPAEGEQLNPEAANSMTLSFVVENFVIDVPSGNGDGHVHYTVDGGSTVMYYSTDPIELTNIGTGQHTVHMWLVDNNHDPLVPPVEADVNFEVLQYINVANLAELRASELGGYYHVTGEVITDWGDSTTSGALIGFVQDDTAGMYIYSPSPSPLENLDIEHGDGLLEVKGQLQEYHGMLELIPTAAPVINSSGNTITPQAISIQELNTNGEEYEGELVELSEWVSISDVDGGDGTFQPSTSYPITGIDTGDEGILRTLFIHADYIGDVLLGEAGIIGIVSEYDGVYQITPRSNSDFLFESVEDNPIPGFEMYPNPAEDIIYIRTQADDRKDISIMDITGKVIREFTLDSGSFDVSGLPAGMYLIRVTENDAVSVGKVYIK